MSDDIGPGDVVAAKVELSPCDWHGLIPVGTRAIVAKVEGDPGACSGACGAALRGFQLVEYPLPVGWAWCPCAWRKIGGSRGDTLARFEADLVTAARRPPAKAPV